MSPEEIGLGAASLPRPRHPLAQLLSCIRYDEVIVLQGPPLLGACLTIGTLSADKVTALGLLVAGNLCLVAHVFVINDWSGIEGDLRDPHRAARTFVTRGVSQTRIGWLAAALLLASLLLFGLLGPATLSLAVAIAALSALYSAPAFHMKGLPVACSILHLVGGALHFLLGFAAFATIDGGGVATSLFFALVFTAGHLMHEARGREGDAINGIRTNAVVFGQRQSLVAGLVTFTAAQVLLFGLAATGVLPRVLMLTAVLYPVLVQVSFQALREGATLQVLCRLQRRYRELYALIGLMMVLASRLT